MTFCHVTNGMTNVHNALEAKPHSGNPTYFIKGTKIDSQRWMVFLPFHSWNFELKPSFEKTTNNWKSKPFEVWNLIKVKSRQRPKLRKMVKHVIQVIVLSTHSKNHSTQFNLYERTCDSKVSFENSLCWVFCSFIGGRKIEFV